MGLECFPRFICPHTPRYYLCSPITCDTRSDCTQFQHSTPSRHYLTYRWHIRALTGWGEHVLAVLIYPFPSLHFLGKWSRKSIDEHDSQGKNGIQWIKKTFDLRHYRNAELEAPPTTQHHRDSVSATSVRVPRRSCCLLGSIPHPRITQLTASPQPQCSLELQTNLPEDYAKFYNHGEGPY